MRRRVADITLLLLVLATGTLARYKRDTAGLGFADEASISAGSDHVGGKFQKSVGFKLPLLGELAGGSKRKGSKETDLDVIGGFSFGPEMKIQDDGGLGISLGGSAGAGVGTSNEGAIVGGDAGLGLSFGPHGISANLGGGVLAGAGGGKKHDGERHHHGVWWEEHHQGVADSNGGEHWENSDQKTSGQIVVAPISGGSGSIGGSAHWTSGNGANNGEKGEGKIVLPHGDKGGYAGASGSAHVGIGGSHDHGVIKGGAGIGGGIVISHGNSGQWSGNKGHDKGSGNGHVHAGGGIIISHGGSKGHQGTSNGTKGDGENGKQNGGDHIGGGIVVSIGDAGQSSSHKGHNHGNGNGNGHVHGGGGIIISHGGHGGSKGHEGTSKVNGTKGQKGGNESSHHAGGGGIVISHGSGGQFDNNKEHNGKGSVHKGGDGVVGIGVNHGKGGGKDINVTIGVGHGGNQNGNAGKGSGREKHDWRWKNCGILNNRRCGSNVKETLEFIRMFVRYCDAIVHFLLELKDGGLRSSLCRISPRSSKLSCQLGCNILRIRPLFDYA